MRAQSTPTVRIAYLPTENGAQVLYAQELGFFVKAGIDVHLEPMNFSGAIASAVLSNAVDIGNGSTLTLAVAHNKGLPLVFIAPANEFLLRADRRSAAGIVVKASSSIRTAKDLDGQNFGCAGLGSFGEFIPRAWVDANGGDSSTMKFVEFPNSELGAAVASGRVAAAFISSPAFTTALRENGRLLAVGSDAVAREFLSSGWFTTLSWAKANPAAVAAFAAAIRNATVWYNANPGKAAEILAEYLKLDPATVASSNRAVFPERLAAALLQPPINVTARYSKFAAFPAGDLIYVPSR